MSALAGAIAWWTHLYAGNDAVQLTAAGGHLASIAYALRYAIAGDMAALKLTALTPASRAASETAQIGMSQRDITHITTITRAHRHVIAGLACAVVAGLAQLFAQLDYLPRSPIFWIKMLTLVALLANGRIIQLAGRRVAANTAAANMAAANERTTLRLAAMRSVALWIAMIILGLLLTTVSPDA